MISVIQTAPRLQVVLQFLLFIYFTKRESIFIGVEEEHAPLEM